MRYRPETARKATRIYLVLLALPLLVSCAESPPKSSTPLSASTQTLNKNVRPGVVDDKEYAVAVKGKIARLIVIPAGIPPSAVAVVEVQLFLNGITDRVTIVQSSGYASYDAAILNAIQRAQPFPVMKSWVDSGKTEELRLIFQPS